MTAPILDRRRLPDGMTMSQWRAPDGWTIRRMDWPQPPGATPRGRLMFAGGRGDFVEKYIEAEGHWHARGWSVSAFDWRGQGGSAGDIVGGHVESFDPLVADAAALIAAWAMEEPGPHVAIGHSMGGHLLLRVLAEHRPSIDAAVLVAPMLGVNSAPIPSGLGGLIAAVAARVGISRGRVWKEGPPGSPGSKFRQTYLTGSLERFEDEQWWKARHPAYSLGPPTWGWMAAAYASMRRLTPAAVRHVAVPTFVIGTDRDRLVDPLAIRRMAALLPDADLHMYAEAAHELLREDDAVRVDALARIDAFLDRRAA